MKPANVVELIPARIAPARKADASHENNPLLWKWECGCVGFVWDDPHSLRSPHTVLLYDCSTGKHGFLLRDPHTLKSPAKLTLAEAWVIMARVHDLLGKGWAMEQLQAMARRVS